MILVHCGKSLFCEDGSDSFYKILPLKTFAHLFITPADVVFDMINTLCTHYLIITCSLKNVLYAILFKIIIYL